MQVLKLKLYQESACYTKPFASKVGETYPLPPYSTVIGMLHQVLKATSYHEMNVSIQGCYKDKFVDLRRTEFHKKSQITTYPLKIHLLYGIQLVIHVIAETRLMETLYHRLLTNQEYLSLGRREDLVRIDKVQMVQVQKCLLDDFYPLKYDTYLPAGRMNEYQEGIHYQLNTKYEIHNQRRVWETIRVIYAEAGTEIEENKVLKDEEDDSVFFYQWRDQG